MRRLALLALVLGAAALAQFPQHRLFEQPNLQRFVTAAASAVGWGGGYFSAFSSDAGYRGLDVAQSLVSQLTPGLDAGDWWTYDAVEGSAGSLVFSGTAGTRSIVVLPDGPSGNAHTARVPTVGAPWWSAEDGGANCTNEMTVCYHGILGTGTVNQWLVARFANGTGDRYQINQLASSTGSFSVYHVDGGATSTGLATSNVNPPAGSPLVACGRYYWDGGSENTGGVVQYCVNGTCGSEAVAPGPLSMVVGQPTCFGSRGGSGCTQGIIDNPAFGAFLTCKTLSATHLTAIARAVLVDVPRGVTSDGDAGVALALTRASAKTCAVNNDGWGPVSTLPNGRACIAGGMLWTHAAGTNNAQQSETLCTAPWVSMVPCVANAALAPNGTLTAESLYHDGGTSQCWTQAFATTSATRHAFGAYITGGTSAAATVALVGTGSSAGDCTASSTSLDAGAAYRLECTSPAAYAGTLTGVTMSICADAPGLVYVWGAQHETGKAAAEKLRPYYPTTSAAGAWSADVTSFGMQTSAIALSGSAAATITSDTASPGGAVLFLSSTARPLAFPLNGNSQQVAGASSNTKAIVGVPTNFRIASSWSTDGGMTIHFPDGGSTTAAFAGYMALAATDAGYVGGNATSGAINGGIGNVCISSDPTVCR